MGSVIGSVVEGVGGLLGAEKSGDAQVKAAKQAAQQFRPFNVRTDLGTVEFSDGGTKISAMLGEYGRPLLNRQVSEANRGVDDAANEMYDRLSALSARETEDTRRRARETLFRSGRLGTSGGIRELGEVETALANARLSRELAAMDYSANLRQNAFNNFMALSQAPATNLGALSLNRNPAAAVSAAGMINASAGQQFARNQAIGQIAGGVGNALGQISNQTGLTDWFNNSIGSIFGSPTPSGPSGQYNFSGNGGGLSPAQFSAFGF